MQIEGGSPYKFTVQSYGHSASAILEALDDGGPCFLWESSPSEEKQKAYSSYQAGRYSYIGLYPKALLKVHDRDVLKWSRDAGLEKTTLGSSDTPFSILKETFLEQKQDLASGSLPPFSGGAVGFFAYDSMRYLEKIEDASFDNIQPDSYFFFTDVLIVLDHKENRIELIAQSESSRDRLEFLASKLLSLKNFPVIEKNIDSLYQRSLEFSSKFSQDNFEYIVRRAQDYIAAGDVFQVVLANTVNIPKSPNPFSVYQYLRLLNPSPYHFLVRFEDRCLVGASPEMFLQGDKSSIRMRPVAGTYPRDRGYQLQSEKLQKDFKERAEHIMLVDHVRNDIGRVSQSGTVAVEDLLSVETYTNVYHLVSEVSGRLKEGEDIFSALEACFPIATLTGTPKVRAMEIITELEGPSRGIFGGSVCMFGWDGFVDSSVAIRSMLIGPENTTVQGGAGIVYDSQPEREYQECLWKMKSMLDAISMSD